MKKIAMLFLLLSLTACAQQKEPKAIQEAATNEADATKAAAGKFKVTKSDEEWQRTLTPEQYYILREKGTERPGTGEYWKHFEKGVYVCAACGNPLFASDAKFDSECGWPSFDQALKGSVVYHHDSSHGMDRTEVMCANCGGHLGHVFDDGPKKTTGNRFCTNSVSIKFVPGKK